MQFHYYIDIEKQTITVELGNFRFQNPMFGYTDSRHNIHLAETVRVEPLSPTTLRLVGYTGEGELILSDIIGTDTSILIKSTVHPKSRGKSYLLHPLVFFGDDSYIASKHRITKVLKLGYQSWDQSSLTLPGPVEISYWVTCLVSEASAFAIGAIDANTVVTNFVVKTENKIARLVATSGSPPDNLEHHKRLYSLEKLEHEPGGALTLPEIVMTYGDNYHQAMQRYAAMVAQKIQPIHWTAKRPVGWISWYSLPYPLEWSRVQSNLSKARDYIPKTDTPFLWIIDDGWQESYGDWHPGKNFPALPEMAKEIRRAGFIPGIWCAPFLVDRHSQLASWAPDSWFLQDARGRRFTDNRFQNRSIYILNSENIEVQRFLEETFMKFRKSGFAAFKVDFIYAAATAKAKPANKPAIGRLVSGLAAIKKGIQSPGFLPDEWPSPYVIACGAPVLPSIGFAHAFRFSQDIALLSPDPDTKLLRTKTSKQIVRSVALALEAFAPFNGMLFSLDTDAVTTYCKDIYNNKLSLDDLKLMLAIAIASGGPILVGIDLNESASTNFIALLQRLSPIVTQPTIQGPQIYQLPLLMKPNNSKGDSCSSLLATLETTTHTMFIMINLSSTRLKIPASAIFSQFKISNLYELENEQDIHPKQSINVPHSSSKILIAKK
jgi:hypothetical protein